MATLPKESCFLLFFSSMENLLPERFVVLGAGCQKKDEQLTVTMCVKL
jgi:hypothetical protein